MGKNSSYSVLVRHFFLRLFNNDFIAFEDQMKEKTVSFLALISILSAHIANAVLMKYMFVPDEGISWVEIKLKDYNSATRVASEIEEELGYPYTTLTWFDLNKSLFSWMEIEKWGAFIILSLIIMVAAFNIISSLIMIVMEKTKDIAILIISENKTGFYPCNLNSKTKNCHQE